MAGEKILNIDDSPTVQRLIEMILSSQGYQVLLASDGEAGIAVAKAEKPAVILVDFVMPKMNGFQVCKTLKEDPEFKDTPIILVTSKGEKVGSKFVDVLGITEYFTKPFQPEELLAKIREVIDKQQEAAPSAPAPAAKKRTAAPPAAAASHATSVPAGLESAVREIVERVMDEFVQQTLPDLIRRELGRSGVAGVRPPAAIQGNLASFRIVEVMQMVGLQRQTGTLAISRRGEDAYIYFRDGAVVFATANCGDGNPVENLLRRTCRLAEESLKYVQQVSEMTSQPIDSVLAQEKLIDLKTFADCLKRHTESAVYKIMAWRQGDFSFEKGDPPVFTTAMQIKVDDLLLEGARRADEWTLIQQKIPSFNAVYEPMIGDAQELTTRGMSEIDMTVFSLIDGRRTIQDIIDESCLSDFDVAKSVFILHSVNLVRKK